MTKIYYKSIMYLLQDDLFIEQDRSQDFVKILNQL